MGRITLALPMAATATRDVPVVVAKNRHGDTGKVERIFHRERLHQAAY